MSPHRASVLLLAWLLAGCAGDPPAAGPAAEPPLEPWVWQMPHCVAYDPDGYATPGRRMAVTHDGTRVTEAYQPGWGTRAMAEVRTVVADCASYQHGDGDRDAFREQHTIEDAGFAGQESLLVRTVRLVPPAPPQVRYAAVVRRGDEVTTARAETAPAAVCAAVPASCPGGGA